MKKRKFRILLILSTTCALFCIALIVGLVVYYNSGTQQKDYQPIDSPEATAYNYLMALVKKEYGRAYEYLSPTLPQYPEDLDTFILDLREHDLMPVYELDPCVYIEGIELQLDQAKVELRMQYYDPCLLGWWLEVQNLTQTPGQMTLEQIEGSWKIVDADDWLFYHKCWSEISECE